MPYADDCSYSRILWGARSFFSMSREFDRFLRQVCPGLDLEWRKYRRKGARKRVVGRIRKLGLAGYDEYREYLLEHPEEAEGLAGLMLVTVSRFFRDRECWQDLIHVLADSVKAGGSKTIRALSAGSCGGEEPYSLAIAWKALLEPEFANRTLEIVAIDLDEPSLARAREGLYAERTLREMDPRLREEWFEPAKGMLRLCPEIREMVAFRRADLMRDELGGPYDLVLCRYLFFTYYSGQRRRRAAERLWESLCPGGLLMIGAREELGQPELRLFEPVAGAKCLYRSAGRRG
jgi:chemotaxis protein methyltransferase CheR